MRSEALKKAQTKYEATQERVVIKFPLGYKKKIEALAKAKGFDNVSQFFKNFIDKELKNK